MSALQPVLRRMVDVEHAEVPAMLMGFTYFFFVLASWFVLRPIREAAAVAAGTTLLPWLFFGSLVLMLIANPLFSMLVVRFPVRRFIAITYHFFLVNLLAFYVLLRVVAPTEGSDADKWIGRAFFIWTSVFNLFVVSVFWCFMADYFRSDQAKRLFGFMALGGTLGSIAGSATTASLASTIGTPNLLLVSCVLLELAVISVLRFPAKLTEAGTTSATDLQQPIGGSVLAGVTNVMKSPYLLGISLFLILLVVGATVLYFEQADIVGRAYADRAARTTVLARIELAVQTLTLITQLFLTGRIIRWVGLAVALAFLPAISIVGFAVLGAAPSFVAVASFAILRRAGNFALNNPAMEILFTVVPREDKYKAKSFIETFVYRGGDQIGAWSFAGLTALGLGLTGIAYASVPIAAGWLILGVWLGRRQAAMAASMGRGGLTAAPIAGPLATGAS